MSEAKGRFTEGEERRCGECGKPLRAVACYECGGSGRTGFLFFKRTCPACHGSGRRYRCEDERKHAAARLREMEERLRRRLRGAGRAPQAGQVCAACGGRGWIYNPGYHQLAPYAGAPGRVTCPACGGSGRVVRRA